MGLKIGLEVEGRGAQLSKLPVGRLVFKYCIPRLTALSGEEVFFKCSRTLNCAETLSSKFQNSVPIRKRLDLSLT